MRASARGWRWNPSRTHTHPTPHRRDASPAWSSHLYRGRRGGASAQATDDLSRCVTRNSSAGSLREACPVCCRAGPRSDFHPIPAYVREVMREVFLEVSRADSRPKTIYSAGAMTQFLAAMFGGDFDRDRFL